MRSTFLKHSEKKSRLGETLNKNLKQHRQQDRKIALYTFM